MDLIAIILVAVVLISATVWAIVAHKMKSHVSDGYKADNLCIDEDNLAKTEDSKDVVDQIVIYRNHVKDDAVLCPCCDGENSKVAEKCIICSSMLK